MMGLNDAGGKWIDGRCKKLDSTNAPKFLVSAAFFREIEAWPIAVYGF
jgi:hypothetical protein